MDATLPLFLLVIAGLVVAAVAAYYGMRQAEGAAFGHQALLAEELREAQEALRSAVREAREPAAPLTGDPAVGPPTAPSDRLPPLAPQVASAGEGPAAPVPSSAQVTRATAPLSPAGPERRADLTAGRPEPALPTPRPGRAQVTKLALQGVPPVEIARRLGVTVAEVELLLSLSSGGRR